MITKLMRGNTAHIDSAAVSKLKKQAKELKRSSNLTHTEALEQTAKKFGFDNWHQVIEGNKIFHGTERAFKEGIFAVFDAKDADEIFDKRFLLIEDDLAEVVVRAAYYQYFINLIDEDDEQLRPMKEVMGEDELQEYFEDEVSSMVFYRLNVFIPGLDDESACYSLNSLLQKSTFRLPTLYIVNGKFIENDHTFEMNWDDQPDDRYREEHWPENQKRIESGIYIDPNLPDDFEGIDNGLRAVLEIKHWWDVPFIRTVKNDSGEVYVVRRLDGGAWDRSTNKGGYNTLTEAVDAAKRLK